MMKLHYSRNLNPRLCVAAARQLRAPVEYIVGQPRDPAQRAFYHPLNPNLLVPILLEDGMPPLWETDAIVCRLSRVVGSEFFPEGAELPEVLRWLSWSAYHFVRAGSAFYFDRIVCPRYGLPRPGADEMAAHLADFHACARIVDDVLAGQDWLVGRRVTYADFRVGSVLPFADEAGLPVGDYPNLSRFGARLNELPAWRDPFAGLDAG